MNTHNPDPFHLPVMVQEFLDFFAPVKITHFFDGTLGAGGHAKALLEAHREIKSYIGTDQDPHALTIAKNTLSSFPSKVHFVKDNFSHIRSVLQSLSIPSVDGIFFDLGLSSMQIDSEERGFSFRFDAFLDMRMDPKTHLTASEILNNYSEKDIGMILRDFGEEKQWRKIANAIVFSRTRGKIETTKDLLDILNPLVFRKKNEKIHPATRTFQALRIAVNDELTVLQKGLEEAISLLSEGGRIGVISFHSLEDRIVKQTFQKYSHRAYSHSLEKERRCLEILTKKPLLPKNEEIKANPRARSAKLRFAEKRKEP